jgi:hypothetical protein
LTKLSLFYCFIFLMIPINSAWSEPAVRLGPSAVKSVERLHSNERIVNVGHNLSPAANQLAAGQLTMGGYFSGYGISESVMVGTSPWLASHYNMYSGFLQARSRLTGSSSLAMRFGYMRTFEGPNLLDTDFQMEAASASVVYGVNVNSRVRLHLNATIYYFLEETFPFSIRREPGTDDPYQHSVSLLVESQLTRHWRINGEVGVLGLSYLYPQLISGGSLGYQNGGWYTQLGFSVTGTPRAYFSSAKADIPIVDLNDPFDREQMKYDFSIHPEVQLQYYF